MQAAEHIRVEPVTTASASASAPSTALPPTTAIANVTNSFDLVALDCADDVTCLVQLTAPMLAVAHTKHLTAARINLSTGAVGPSALRRL